MSIGAGGQTSVSTNIGAGFAGQLADGYDNDIVSRTQGEASAHVPFGVCMKLGATDLAVLLPSATTDKLAGPVVHSHQYAKGLNGELDDTGIIPKAQLNILNQGRIRVQVEEAVTQGDRVWIRCGSTGGSAGTQQGAFRKSDEVISSVHYCIDATKQGRYETSAGAAGFAIVQWDALNL